MDQRFPALILVCIAAVMIAGCTVQQQPVGSTTPASGAPPPAVISTTTVPPPAVSGCTRDEDCVPARCCHPTSCTNTENKGVCNEMCTMNCAGPLDCGAGSCGCVHGTCSIVSAPSAQPSPGNATSIHITATPRRYSPLMSSTPGVGLTITTSGFTAADAIFSWNATYGEFLSWNAPDYKVNPLKNPVTNHGEELYWSFTDKPASTAAPVIITVVAKDPDTGTVLGTSQVTLAWDGDFAVAVKEIQ
jgi:hypothetical protein